MSHIFKLDSNINNISVKNNEILNILQGEKISNYTKSINFCRKGSICSINSSLNHSLSSLFSNQSNSFSAELESLKLHDIKDFKKSDYVKFILKSKQKGIPNKFKKRLNIYSNIKDSFLVGIKNMSIRGKKKMSVTSKKNKKVAEEEEVEVSNPYQTTTEHTLDNTKQKESIKLNNDSISLSSNSIPDTPITIDKNAKYDLEALHKGATVINGTSYYWRDADEIFIDDKKSFYEMSYPNKKNSINPLKSDIQTVLLHDNEIICPIIPVFKDPMLHQAEIIRKRRTKSSKLRNGDDIPAWRVNSVKRDIGFEDFAFEQSDNSNILRNSNVLNNSSNVDISSYTDIISSSLNLSEESESMSNVVDVGPESSSSSSSSSSSESSIVTGGFRSSDGSRNMVCVFSNEEEDDEYVDDYLSDDEEYGDMKSDDGTTTIVLTTGATTMRNATITSISSASTSTSTSTSSSTASSSSFVSSSSTYWSILQSPAHLYKTVQSAHI